MTQRVKYTPARLQKLYIDLDWQASEIAQLYGVGERTVYDWLAKHDIYKTKATEPKFCKTCGHSLVDN